MFDFVARMRVAQITLQLPLAVSVVYLLVCPAWYNLDSFLMSSSAAYVQMVLLVALPILALFRPCSRIFGCSRISLSSLIVCSLVPLAVLDAWVPAPGFPGALGGYRYFLHWLTKYPNFGPINIEVLLGLVCVLMASFIPAVFAIFASAGRLRPSIALAIIAGELLFLVPVILSLDIGLLLAGVSFKSPLHFMGPVLRFTGLIFMGVFARQISTKRIEHGAAPNCGERSC
jgi:hypothetical protein